MTNATVNASARELAQAWIEANIETGAKKTAKQAEILAQVQARAKVSKRQRWGRIAKAMAANDAKRVLAYASTGEDKAIAWAEVRKAPAKPKAAAKPKTRRAPAKPKAKAPAKPKAEPKAEMDAPTLDALAKMVAQSGEANVEQFLVAFKRYL